MSCHQWCECPKCTTFYDECFNEIPNPHTGTLRNEKTSEYIGEYVETSQKLIAAQEKLSEAGKGIRLSESVLNYAHEEVSGEWVGDRIDVALMNDHRLLKKKLKLAVEALAKYAAFTNWKWDGNKAQFSIISGDDLDGCRDTLKLHGGKHAREALAKLKG